MDFFGSEYFDSFGQCPKFEDWDICVPQYVPAQANAYDCGVHVCISSYSLCHGIFCMYEKDASTLIRSWIATNVINTDSATLLIPHSKASSDPTLSVMGSAPTAGKFQISRNPPTAYVSTKDFFLHWVFFLFQGIYSIIVCFKVIIVPVPRKEIVLNPSETEKWSSACSVVIGSISYV